MNVLYRMLGLFVDSVQKEVDIEVVEFIVEQNIVFSGQSGSLSDQGVEDLVFSYLNVIFYRRKFVGKENIYLEFVF